jgi:hypothetical protein
MSDRAVNVLFKLLLPLIIVVVLFAFGVNVLAGIADLFNPAVDLKYTYSDGVIWIQDKKDYVLCDNELNIIFKLSDKHEGFVPQTNFYNGVAAICNNEDGLIGTIDKNGESIWFDDSYKEKYPEITNWERADADPNNFYGYAWMTGYNELNNYFHYIVIGPDGKLWRDLGKNIFTDDDSDPERDDNYNQYGDYGNGIYNTINGWYNIQNNEFSDDKPEAMIKGELLDTGSVFFSVAEDFTGTLFPGTVLSKDSELRLCIFYSMSYPELRMYRPDAKYRIMTSPTINTVRFPYTKSDIYSHFPTNTKFQKYGFINNNGDAILDLSQYNLLYAPKFVNNRALLYVIGTDYVINFLIIDMQGNIIYIEKSDIVATKDDYGSYEETELSSVPSNKLFSYQFANGNILFNKNIHDSNGNVLFELPKLGKRFTYITEMNSNVVQIETIKNSFGRDKRNSVYYIDINTGDIIKPH